LQWGSIARKLLTCETYGQAEDEGPTEEHQEREPDRGDLDTSRRAGRRLPHDRHPDRSSPHEDDQATQELADAWLLEARYLASQGAFVSYDTENLTVAEFVGRWLEDEVRPTVRAVTFAGYEQTHRLRIAPPPLGTTRLSALSVANCQAWRPRMAKNGVTVSELGKAIRLLKRALEQAFAWEMIPKNPAAHLKAPRYRPKETAYVRAEDVGRYLAAVRGDPFEALFVVAALGGPRSSSCSGGRTSARPPGPCGSTSRSLTWEAASSTGTSRSPRWA
jgi:hypothetical protein